MSAFHDYLGGHSLNKSPVEWLPAKPERAQLGKGLSL